jgi:ABC-type phosphate transport system substrate-binding protein
VLFTRFKNKIQEMKMFKKAISASVLALGLSVGLTACDPPMPPDVLAALAEQVVTCEPGAVNIAFPDSLADLTGGWSGALADSCADMSFNALSADDETADVIISATGQIAATCKPFEQVPFAQDGTVLAFLNSELASLDITPEVVAGILSGKITDWSDPAITEANGGTAASPLPINVLPTAQSNGLAATKAWLKAQGLDDSASKVSAVPFDDGSALMAMAEGDVVLTAYSAALYNYSTVASVTLDGEVLQYLGGYTIDAYLCGQDTLVKRAVVKYLLRQDSQGALLSGVVLPLGDEARMASVTKVSKGLPVPSDLPTPEQ